MPISFIVEPPNFHVKMKSESIKKGDSAELECTCTGDSPIEMNWWLKDERTMIKDEKGRYMYVEILSWF